MKSSAKKLLDAKFAFALGTVAYAGDDYLSASVMFERCGKTYNRLLGWRPETARAIYRYVMSMSKLRPADAAEHIRMLNAARLVLNAFPYDAGVAEDQIIILNQLSLCEMARTRFDDAAKLRALVRDRESQSVIENDLSTQLVAAAQVLKDLFGDQSLEVAGCFELAGRSTPGNGLKIKLLEKALDILVREGDQTDGFLRADLGEALMAASRKETARETLKACRSGKPNKPPGRFREAMEHFRLAQLSVDAEFGPGSEESFQLLKQRLRLTGDSELGPQLRERIEKESPFLQQISAAVDKYSSFLLEGSPKRTIPADQLARFARKLVSLLVMEVSVWPVQIGEPIRSRANPVFTAFCDAGLDPKTMKYLEGKIVEAGPDWVRARTGVSSLWQETGEDKEN